MDDCPVVLRAMHQDTRDVQPKRLQRPSLFFWMSQNRRRSATPAADAKADPRECPDTTVLFHLTRLPYRSGSGSRKDAHSPVGSIADSLVRAASMRATNLPDGDRTLSDAREIALIFATPFTI